MPEMMFYERIVALDDQTHAGLKMRPASSFAYASNINSVPLLIGECFECAREYPIVFLLGEDGLVPAALVGLREGENLYVRNGKWEARYVPAFVRRYPFVAGKGAHGELLVCIDEASPCFGVDDGEALFVDGKPSAQLEHAISFVTEFHQAARSTGVFGRRLQELGLLRQADSVAQLKDGSEFRLNGLKVVDEMKLRGMDRDTVHELFSNGSLAVIYAHLMSLRNLASLVDRLSQRSADGKTAARA